MPILRVPECNSGLLETFPGEQQAFHSPIVIGGLHVLNTRPSIPFGVRWLVI